ncbi:MAG: ROK family protein [Acidobacteria bacterium]|nr:ROK family protein [Acidobacteriota bacterium]
MAHVFAVDIGGTQIKAARVDERGSVVASRRIDTPATLDAFVVVARMLARELGDGALAAGIGCKGIINPRTTKVEVLPGTVHYLEGHTLAELFGLGAMPVAADNDARVALLGERRWGAARGLSDVIMLTLGTGVGGGILTGGVPVRGAIGAGGHLGHLTVDPHGVTCICGNRGCLETVFSSKAIEAAAFSAQHRGVAGTLLSHGKPPTCEQVFREAAEGDAVAREIVERGVALLAGAIAALAFVFDPELVILGGQIADAGDVLLAPLRRQFHERTVPLLRREIPVVRTRLSDPSGVLGAAALAWDACTTLAGQG